jgi:parvulin-like peptidyl-prolyl cis-trans isomerase-like protein
VSFRRLTLCCVLFLAGCKRPPSARPWVPEPRPELGAVVARVGEVPIFAAEVRGQAVRTGKAPRQALTDLIELHLLAEQVRDRWPPQDRDPQARTLEQEILVQRLLERDFEARTRLEDMPDSAVRVLYDAAIDKFVHPRLVEVAVLALTPGKKATPEVRAAARKTMTELKAQVDLRKERTPEDLQAAIATGGWREKRVQFFRFMQAGDKPYSARFGAEVGRLKTPGETAGLIEDEYGFYIARFVSERPPQNQTFEQVKKELREGFYPRWRQMKFLEFSQQLAASHEVELHTGALNTAPGS